MESRPGRYTSGSLLSWGENFPDHSRWVSSQSATASWDEFVVSNQIRGKRTEWHPLSFDRTRTRFPYGATVHAQRMPNDQLYFSGTSGYHDTGNFPWVPLNLPIDSTAVYNRCIDKLYEGIRGKNTLDLATSLAEGRQVKSMLANALPRVGKAGLAALHVVDQVRRFRHLKGGSVFRALKRDTRDGANYARTTAGSLWLETVYAIQPALSDIHALLEQVANIGSSPFGVVTVTVRAGQREEISDYLPGINPIFRNGYHSVRYRISVQFTVSDPALFDVSRVTSLNPLRVAWELVPYSFVVDWFVDVGGYLASMEAALVNGLAFQRGLLTRTEKSFQRNEFIKPWQPPRNVYDTAQAHSLWSEREFISLRRSLLGSFPLPAVPSFHAQLGSTRLLSAAALLNNFLPRRI